MEPSLLKLPSSSIQCSNPSSQQIQAKLRVLQKKYKDNVKAGFEKKIQAYRLQAVMERKAEWMDLKIQVEEVEEQIKNDKAQRAAQMRQMDAWKKKQLENYREQLRQQLKGKHHSQKKELNTIQQERMAENNSRVRSIKNRVKQEYSRKDTKKLYFDSLRVNSVRKDVNQTKQYYLNRIASQTEELKELKEKLSSVSQQNTSQIVSSPFITI